ncbi:MAG: DUF86 domain-containing protein [Bacteroidetes bacterium]|nr:DUF86 domain-containing protein [Bacteroidota bacterium]
MQPNDRIRIKHMIDAAEEAISFVEGKYREALDSERMLVLSLVKEIEIIGEAAVKVSVEVKEINSQVPWDDITGMRNHLVHGYFDVDLDMLWNTVKLDLPMLLIKLKKIIS